MKTKLVSLRKLTSTIATAVIFFSLSLNVSAGIIKTDFVFIIDATGSMTGEIAGVRAGFSTFVANLNLAAVDARFAVVVFGGDSELTLDFTANGADAQTALNNIVIGSNAFQNNHNLNPEAGLEAIRMVLGEATNSNLDNNNIAADGILNFRADARKNLILVTDEDSDRGGIAANWFAGQTSNDPPSGANVNTVNAAWQAEVDATAAAVINNNAFLNMLISHNAFSESQYGDYIDDVSDLDLLNFDKDLTLANLLADLDTNNSLQAQVLQAGLIARTFNVAGANDPDFVNNFFAAKLDEVITDPGPVPEPATIALFGLGLVALRLMRKRKIA